MKGIKFLTLGCKVNQYETQKMREDFLRSGFRELSNGKPADVCVINTCTVTSRSDTDSLNLIRRAIRENPKAKIIATGCLPERDKSRIRGISSRIVILRNRDKEKISARSISYFEGRTRAFVKVQDGCNNFCSYCKVPLVRGRSRSRGPQDIVKEARALVRHGYKEIVLCGICLGAYGKDFKKELTLTELIERLERINGLLRIRLSSIEANDVSDALIRKISVSRKLCRHLHIPLQSGDDEILKKMNRRYTSAGFLRVIRKAKKAVPDIAITTDVLVGFPGEKELNFDNTAQVIRKMLPLRAHIFPYSRREGTLASRRYLEDEIPVPVMQERAARLRSIAAACAQSYMKKQLGKEALVLIEGRCKGSNSSWEGHTDTYMKVIVSSKRSLENKLVKAKLLKVAQDGMLADIS